MSTHAEVSQGTVIPATIARIRAYFVRGGLDDIGEGIGYNQSVVSWKSKDVKEDHGGDRDKLR
jgi:hypothetical protein